MLPKHLFYTDAGKDENTSQAKNLYLHFTCQQHGLLSANDFQPVGSEIPKPVVSHKLNSRGNLRSRWVSLPWKGVSEKQCPKFSWFLPQEGHVGRQRDTNHSPKWHRACVSLQARTFWDSQRALKTGAAPNLPTSTGEAFLAFFSLWKMLQSKPKGTRLWGDSESRALVAEYSFLLDEGWRQQELFHLNSQSPFPSVQK